jgi:hypothetical protein
MTGKTKKSVKKDYYELLKEKVFSDMVTKVKQPSDPVFLEAYKEGRKDMGKLLQLGLSLQFLKYFTFTCGMSRKSEESDPLLKAYCDGWNNKLAEELK